ncbi:hypothetical protein B0T25DRAFT_281049 [Lasiosphaeria hispida]|uniref:Uncharacterized protein n=1 Tax=Lasiosphaeria hispida TaxID=260671 RepID=A0AAJ0MAS1_9PEZI|nr:hypothetical protein B0T25DRAFT_281049 [Lasiosphaeria hispida]
MINWAATWKEPTWIDVMTALGCPAKHGQHLPRGGNTLLHCKRRCKRQRSRNVPTPTARRAQRPPEHRPLKLTGTVNPRLSTCLWPTASAALLVRRIDTATADSRTGRGFVENAVENYNVECKWQRSERRNRSPDMMPLFPRHSPPRLITSPL